MIELADKHAITEQIYRYCRSVDRLDVPLGYSVFHADATADYGPSGYRGSGHGAIDWICAAHGHLAGHSHQVTNVLIELDGARAGSEAYVTATLRIEREGRLMQMEVWGRYCDRWSQRDGVWRIDHRDAVTDYDAIREITPIHRPDVSGTRSRRDRDDPSYAALGDAR